MASARPLLPTDLLALVSYNGKVYPNEARTRERLGESEPDGNMFETAIEQWLSFAVRRNAWISSRRQRLLGLVSARRRGGRQAWEIDCLIDTTPSRDAVAGLLECAIRAGGKAGAEKLFLRLNANSALLQIAMSAGFSAYCSKRLYVGSALALPVDLSLDLRPFSQADQYPAFRLYNCALPERSRRAEAATFGEWQAAQERQWLKNGGVELVLDGEGGLLAHVRAAKVDQGTLIDARVAGEAVDAAPAMMHAAFRATGSVGPVLTLIHEADVDLASRLEALGFEAREEFFSLMCRTTRVAKMPKLVPASIPNGAVIT
ncbi:MAG TPA: hypothetical protein VH951_10945 [Dehalococcoidia bacterium]